MPFLNYYRDIRYSKPRLDCVFCRTRNFYRSHDKYAECTCPHLCRGLVAVDISAIPDPFNYVYNCRSCKFYQSSFQLSLF